MKHDVRRKGPSAFWTDLAILLAPPLGICLLYYRQKEMRPVSLLMGLVCLLFYGWVLIHGRFSV